MIDDKWRRIRVVLPAASTPGYPIEGNGMRVEDVETGELLGGVTKVEILAETNHIVTVAVTFVDAEIVVR